MDSNHLLDALIYTWSWLHRDQTSRGYRSLSASNDWDYDGGRLSMSKGTMKNKIRFELESREEVHRCEYSIRGLNGIITEAEEHRTLALTFYDAQNCPGQDSRIRTVYNILKNAKVSWQIVGPRCPAISEMAHDVSNVNMISQSALSRHSPYWRCTQAGCGKTVDVEVSGLITFREFQSAVMRASAGEKNIAWVVADVLLMRDLKENFPEATDLTIREAVKVAPNMYRSPYIQSSSMDITNKMSEEMKQRLADMPLTLQVHDEILPDTSAMQKQINQLTAKGDELANKLEANTKQYEEEYEKWADIRQELEQELQNLKRLPTASDAMFRFLAGINMQDHSTSEQKEFLRLMRELKEALQVAGIGSKD